MGYEMKSLKLSSLLLLGGIFSVYAEDGSLLENVSRTTVVPELTSKEMTLEDFVPLPILELINLISSGAVQSKGWFGKYEWFEDKNQTRYIFDVKPRDQVKKDIEAQLENNTGEVCFDGFCVAPHLARAYLENMRAKAENRLLPAYVPRFAVMVSFFIVAGLCGISGNVLIIAGVLASRGGRNSTTVLMCSLSVSDILVLVACLPMQVLDRFFQSYEIIPEVLCRVLMFMPNFSIVTSTLTLSAMAVERYIAICHPLKAKLYCTVRKSVVIVCCVWIAAASLCFPLFLSPLYDEDDKRCRLNVYGWKTYVYQSLRIVFVFIIPILLIFPLYMKIAWVLWRSGRKSNKLQSASTIKQGMETESLRTRKQVIKMLVLLLVAFCLCWGPPVILGMVLLTGRGAHLNIYRVDVSAALNSIGYCNSFLNPVILICMSRKIRSSVTSICRRSRKDQKFESGSTTNNTKLSSVEQP